MNLPLRSTLKDDIQPLGQALANLKEVTAQLKSFQKTESVKGDPGLAAEVDSLRRKIKKARKRGNAVLERWTARASY